MDTKEIRDQLRWLPCWLVGDDLAATKSFKGCVATGEDNFGF